jgi:hypothetical protein
MLEPREPLAPDSSDPEEEDAEEEQEEKIRREKNQKQNEDGDMEFQSAGGVDETIVLPKDPDAAGSAEGSGKKSQAER